MKKICIIGAGPSGLFCAHRIRKELQGVEFQEDVRIIILEQGEKPSQRSCPGKEDGICKKCRYCSVLSGGGGAGLFSDGKMIRDLNVGGHNDTVFSLSPQEKGAYISYVMETLLRHDGVSMSKEKPDQDTRDRFEKKFSQVGLKVKYYDVLHMGSANLAHILDGFVGELEQESVIEIRYGVEVTQIICKNDQYHIYANQEEVCDADFLVMAVGKSGASWLKDVLYPLGVEFRKTGYYFGLRVEMAQEILDPLAELSFDPKIYRELRDGRKIKMHCFCRKGKVIMANYEDCIVTGGHSPYTENNRLFSGEKLGNFNVLLSYPPEFGEEALFHRFKDMDSNMLFAQTLEDFGENNTPDVKGNFAYGRVKTARPENLRTIIGDDYFAKEFIDFLNAVDCIFPGVSNPNNLLYGPSFEWCMDTVTVSKDMETSLPNVFAVGDGAGLSQGIIYSATTGIMAAECIAERVIKNEA